MNQQFRPTRLATQLMAAGVLIVAAPAFAQGANQEVTVTATKVATPASKTPIALTVADGEAMKSAGVTDARGLTELAPNVQIAAESGKLQIAIRGVTSLDMSEKGDPSTAFNVDGAYVPRPEAQIGSFLDLERVEVLRGPQGTLYGRNATGGAINLITAKPDPKRFGGKALVDVGNYGARRTEFVLNAPVNQTLALRAAVATSKRDTYQNPGANTVPLENEDNVAARLHALFTISKDTSLLLTAEHSKVGGNGGSPLPATNFFTGTPIANGNNLANPVYVDRGTTAQLTQTKPFVNATNHLNNTADTLRAEYKTNLGAVDLTYVGAYGESKTDQSDNGTYFGNPFYSDIKGNTKSQQHELRLNSASAGPLRWVAGVYAFNEEISRNTIYYTKTPGPLITVPFKPVVENDSKAVFGQATYSMTPATRLVLGLRGTRDEKTGSDPLGGSVTGPGFSNAKASSSKTNYKLGVDHDLSAAVMAYGSLSTGYKAGGFNENRTGSGYKPETLTAAEVGIKGRFFNNALRLNASAFNYDYKDMQLTSVVCTGDTAASCGSLTTNAARSTIRGLELEGGWSLNKTQQLNFSLGYTDATFDSYKPTTTENWSGKQLDRAPKTGVGLGFTQQLPMADGSQWSLYAGTRYNSGYYISDFAAAVRYKQPSFTKSDLRVTYTPASDKYYVQAYVKNVENKVTIESRVPGSFFTGAPRTFGVRVGANF
ncbi:TonB-dependent receptor [Ramlibacter sp. MAHUQ-53]|uniref:TonB-dependent receptor n=1 Tax=unclassified Ramlibacter TaxID=2617605 RepID=UPI00363A92BF